MQHESSKSLKKSTTLLLGSMAALLVIMIISFPDQAFQSSLQGLQIWWKLVFPALLPFLILTEILIGLGVVQASGSLLQPLMRTLFRLPGASGWALASGLLVGFPTGAKITASLHEKGLLTREEGERLTSLSHVCSPLFLVTVVGVGFMHDGRIGIALAIIHYMSAFAAALFVRNSRANSSSEIRTSREAAGFFETMREAYLRDGRAFGKLLGDAVTSSIHTLMLIGGYIMIFSVIVNVVSLSGILEALQYVTQSLLGFMHLGPDGSSHILKGIFEIHLGAYALGQSQEIPLVWQLALLGAFLGWGGLSAHAQVRGLVQHTSMRYLPFFMTRAAHGIIAFLLTFACWKPLQWLVLNETAPSFVTDDPSRPSLEPALLMSQQSWSSFIPTLLQLLVLLAVMLILSFVISQYLRYLSKR
jgi:sporulation integral membrane protein YlbJ